MLRARPSSHVLSAAAGTVIVAAAAALALALAPPAGAAPLSPNAVAVPLPLPCDLSQASNARHLSSDDSGALWLVAHCTGQLVVTVSLDGGATWEPVSQVAATSAFQVAIEAGAAGSALVAWETPLGRIHASVTDDYGLTWSAPADLIGLATSSSGLSLVIDGDAYHVACWSAFRNVVAIRTSLDAGQSWNPEVTVSMPWAFGDLVHDPGADALELVADSPQLFHRTSADDASTFTPSSMLPGGCCLTSSDWAMGGGRLLFGVGGGPILWRIDLAAATALAVTIPQAASTQRSVDADLAGNAFSAARLASTGAIALSRVAALAAAADPPILLDTLGDMPATLACDEDSAAVAWRGGDQLIWFDKRCADGTWSCCEADANLPPSCDAGGSRVAECEGAGAGAGSGTVVALDGSASDDPEGAPLAFAWSTDCPGGAFDDAASATPLLAIDPGGACDLACSVTLSVSDGLLSSACTATIRVTDATPPVIAESGAVVAELWPPNHRMVPIAAADFAPVVRDACTVAPAWRLLECVSDQPDDATGDGSTSGDCVVEPGGGAILVRAERQGGRPEGRTYSVTATASDACGNASSATLVGRIHVPHDRR